MPSRRNFIKTSSALTAGSMLHPAKSFLLNHIIPVYGHLWVYASRYPPDWNCTPILNDVFSDLKYAGIEGVEIMEILLRHNDAVERFNDLIHKYDLPVVGTSYYGDMWNKDQRHKILDDVELVTQRLHAIGGIMIGLTVGDAQRIKTEDELDVQAELLKKILVVCDKNKIEPNLHNHTFEVINDLHDLKGTLKRIPGIKLGPDLNWLIRAGVDPVWFIKTYADKIVFMHIRDQYANGKWTEYLGQGVTGFPAIAKTLKEIDYKGKAAIELAFDEPPKNPLQEDWKISREYVQKVFGW
jgi:sugar phosphate isomerase/epimerase